VRYQIGAEWQDAWQKTDPHGVGFVRLGPDSRLFSVTMFHQLHCLRILNHAFTGAALAHVTHCIEYLRHAILCSADTTLESGDFTQRNFARERTGETHVCRDWSQVYNRMERGWSEWQQTWQDMGL